jgi:hypothetical protein
VDSKIRYSPRSARGSEITRLQTVLIANRYVELPVLQSLVFSTWNWETSTDELYGDTKERVQNVSPDFRTQLLQVLIAIAFVRGHTDLLESLITATPPEETIFDILNASKIPPLAYDLRAWTILLNSSWIHRPDAIWRREGWSKILTSHMSELSEDNTEKLMAFVKALKKHNIKPAILEIEEVIRSSAPASVDNVAVLLSAFPARSLGPFVNSLLRMTARENRVTKIPMMRALLQAGLDPNWIAPKAYSVLHPDPMGRGEDIDGSYGTTERETALHVAADQGDLVLAKLLLKYGARRWVKDGIGRTAKQRAQRNGHADMARFLQGWFCGLF